MIFDLVGQILLGWLLADFLSGLLHWWEDRIGDARLPILGPHVVVPNRERHDDPLSFTRASFFIRNRVVWVVALVISAIWLPLFGPSVFWLTTAVVGSLVNEIHAMAHAPRTMNVWLKTLAGAGLIQSPAHHARHHRAPYLSHYCIITHWLNPILDHFGFWRGLERALATFGIGLAPDIAAAEKL